MKVAQSVRRAITAVEREPVPLFWGPLKSTDGRPCLPNLSQWRPGDIVLFSGNLGKFPDVTAEAITVFQRNRTKLDPTHLAWVHASVYLGDGVCVESLHNGGPQVILNAMRDRLANSQVRVRRLLRDRAGRRWTAALGRRVAYAALTHLGLSYPGVFDLPQGAAAGPAGQREAVYCSEMCNIAIEMARGPNIASEMGMDPLPAVMSASTLLTDIQVEWRAAEVS